MNFITDYQLDIDKGFMCKVDKKRFDISFNLSSDGEHWFLNHRFEKLLIELELDPNSVVKSYGTLEKNHLVYCNSKQQCYDLCQHIVNTYFRPDTFTKNDEEFTVEINGTNHTFFLTTNILFYWDSNTIESFHFNDHISLVEVKNICYILKINNFKHHHGTIGFETKEDAIKFAKYVITYHYPRKNKKEGCEKSRRYLTKYYADDESYVILNNVQWNLIWDQSRNVWWYHSVTNGVSEYFTQFGLKTAKEVINLCSRLGISAKYINKVEFDSRQDAIKFTDYLIETYIIKKEKTYDTNQLRKERTAISRGAKPAGSIIHGRRGKASIRRGCIKHQTCVGC